PRCCDSHHQASASACWPKLATTTIAPTTINVVDNPRSVINHPSIQLSYQSPANLPSHHFNHPHQPKPLHRHLSHHITHTRHAGAPAPVSLWLDSISKDLISRCALSHRVCHSAPRDTSSKVKTGEQIG